MDAPIVGLASANSRQRIRTAILRCAFAASTMLLAGCAGLSAPRQQSTCEVPMPAVLAAWVCADVMRIEAPGSDPLPYHAGALVTRCSDGFRVHSEQDSRGVWRMSGDLRLLATPTADGGLPTARELPTAACPSPGGAVSRRDVVVQPSGSQTCRLTIGADGEAGDRVRRHIQALLARVAPNGGEPAPPCCPNHTSWPANHWLLVARRAQAGGDLAAALAAAKTAASLDPALAGAHALVGALAASTGADRDALGALRTAMLQPADPEAQAEQVRVLAATKARCRASDRASRLQARAHEVADDGDLPTAAMLRANAAALAADPIADLQLRVHLMRQQGDQRRAFETLLLLRERAPDAAVSTQLASQYARVGLAPLAQRMHELRPETVAPWAALLTMGPIAIREAVEHLWPATPATPPR
jgi:hypothetical protein